MNILVPLSEWRMLVEQIREGDRVGFGPSLRNVRAAIHCPENTVFRPKLQRNKVIALPQAELVRQFIVAHGRGSLVYGGSARPGAKMFEQAIVNRITRGLRFLESAWTGDDSVGKVKKAVQLLIGVGPGTTPSGDDVLIGYLGALDLLSPRIPQADILLVVLRAILADAASLTSPVSRVHMEWAIQGFYSETLLGLLESLKQPDMQWINSCLMRVLETGASSGTDMLIGLSTALEHAKEAGNGSSILA